jgi:hypothetical protein
MHIAVYNVQDKLGSSFLPFYKMVKNYLIFKNVEYIIICRYTGILHFTGTYTYKGGLYSRMCLLATVKPHNRIML